MTATWQLAAAAIVVFLASVFQTLTGFGFSLLSTSVMILVLEPKSAVVLLAVPSCVAAMIAFHQIRRDFAWARIRGYLGWMILGLPIGIVGLESLSPRILKVVMALLLFLVLLGPKAARYLGPIRWAPTSGILGGAISGAVGAPGPAVVAWAHGQPWSFAQKRASTLGIFALASLVRLPAYFARGMLSASELRAAALLVVFALLGAFLGGSIVRRTSDDRAQQISRIALAVLVASMLRSALV